jgi:hypothetical protein
MVASFIAGDWSTRRKPDCCKSLTKLKIKERKNLKLRDARAKSKISVIICDLQYLFSGCFKSSFDRVYAKIYYYNKYSTYTNCMQRRTKFVMKNNPLVL